MHNSNTEPQQLSISRASSLPLPENPSQHSQVQQQPLQQKSSSSPNTSFSTSPKQLPQLSPKLQQVSSSPTLPLSDELVQGEDINAPTGRNVTLSTRIGSTGSELISPVNEARKGTGRRVLHRPQPLDLDYAKKKNLHSQSQQHSLHTAPVSISDTRPASNFPVSVQASGSAILQGQDVVGTAKEPKQKAKLPLLHIKTDLNPTTSFRRAPTASALSGSQSNNNASANAVSGIANPSNNKVIKKEPSKWQVGLERMLKKIQKRKRAPSNIMWYAAHSAAAYMSSSATMDTTRLKGGALKNQWENQRPHQQIDTDLDSLYFKGDKPPKWVVESVPGEAEDMFFSDDTVELTLNLRDYLIKATEGGWDIAELREETFPMDYTSMFNSRRTRSASPHGSPHRASSPNVHAPAPDSPGATSQDSSNSLFEFEYNAQQSNIGRYVDEEPGSYQLLDYLMVTLSDIISHDCRYKVQYPRPSRPEWALHSIILDILFHLSKMLVHDHKAIYDIGMIALSAFTVFQNNTLVRLLDLLTGTILPSFAISRMQSFSSTPPLAPSASNSPLSPSKIRVQLNNNQTFAIQIHSPTEEQGMLAAPRRGRSGGGQSFSSPSSHHVLNSRSNPTSFTQAQDTMDLHASSLISFTLVSMLQQISFTKAPLPVAKQLQKSIGDLLRIKPDLSMDLLQMIAVVENEKILSRALEVLWWISKPSLGHHVLSDKFLPLDYETVLLIRQSALQENMSTMAATAAAAVPSVVGFSPTNLTSATAGSRTNTIKSDVQFSLRRGSLDDPIIPRSNAAVRSDSIGSFGIRSKRGHRSSLLRRSAVSSAHATEILSSTIHPHAATAPTASNGTSSTPVLGPDYLADHELYPYIFSGLEPENDQDPVQVINCERCEAAVKGFGLFCYLCRGALHLDCFYGVKRLAGIDCTQPCCAFDLVSRRPRNQLMYPTEEAESNKNDVLYENKTNQIYRKRAGHHLQLVNLFATCLCGACKRPLWGHHFQAYRCGDCGQLMHLDCQGTPLECGTVTQSLEPRNFVPISISYDDLRQSFLEFYRELISIWEINNPSASSMYSSAPGVAVTAATSIPSPATPLSAQFKERYSYEEASCNASILMLQLELLLTGITREEIQVHEWASKEETEEQPTPLEQGLLMKMTASGFELITLQKFFVDLVKSMQQQHFSSSSGTATAGAHQQLMPLSLFVADFFEDTLPDTLLLFSPSYWSHFAALAKTMIRETEAIHTDSHHHPHQYNHQQYFISTPTESGGGLCEDIFAPDLDTAQEQLLAQHSVQMSHISLSTILRFCIRRLEFHSHWTMQVILQEWVKMGLLERLDGELCLFEVDRPTTITAQGSGEFLPTTTIVGIPSNRSQFSPNDSCLTQNLDLQQQQQDQRIDDLDTVAASAATITSTLPIIQTSYSDAAVGSNNGTTAMMPSQRVVRDVHCLFPMVNAIDPTRDVEDLIHTIWSCLSTINLSINESGFLLLTRHCCPDPFMSDYTCERLVGCIFHWLLLEDEHLISIHKNYTSRGKKIPGVRNDLEEQMARKRALLNTMNITPPGSGDALNSGRSGVTDSPLMSGVTTSSMTAATNPTTTSTTTAAAGTAFANAYSRTNSTTTASNLFGAVGSYVMTRKLMAKKFALPWLKQIMKLDPTRYFDMVYRQIRILEREMVAQDEEGAEEYFTQEEIERFHQRQAERYLESIVKLRQAGFLFDMFPNILCRWLDNLKELMDGMDVSSMNFKTLNKLFFKASARSGSGLGLGNAVRSADGGGSNSHSNTTLSRPILNGYSAATEVGNSGSSDTGAGIQKDNEWRSRLKARLFHDSSNSFVGNQSPIASDASVIEDLIESPLDTLRVILKRSQGPDERSSNATRGNSIHKALFWLDAMVQSGVHVPAQAFLECCESLVDVVDSPDMVPTSNKEKIQNETSGTLSAQPKDASSLTAMSGQKPSAIRQYVVSDSELLELSRDFLKICWRHIVTSVNRMSESETGEIVEAILLINQAEILSIMNQDVGNGEISKDLDSEQRLLKYALAIAMYGYGCPLRTILATEIVPLSLNSKEKRSRQGKSPSGGNSDGNLPSQQQQHYSRQPFLLDRNSAVISMLLYSLRTPYLSLQGEAVKVLSVILDNARRVSNMDDFIKSIHDDVLPIVWEMISPLNDHITETTLPLLMRFISRHPDIFQKTLSHYFNDQDWETRFSALDPVFGLFSKLDDAMVMKLFFQPIVATTSFAMGTMLSSKGKDVERGGIRSRDQRQQQQQHQHRKRPGADPFEFENSESRGTGLSGYDQKDSNKSQGDSLEQHYLHHRYQFLPDQLQSLGPAFTFFVSSMWDKEEAVRTKAKTLLKALQPVHILHALKAWELHFIASPPQAQQMLLKLMTRLNNYFPRWKIMNYGQIFRLLTSGKLGQLVPGGISDASNESHIKHSSDASSDCGMNTDMPSDDSKHRPVKVESSQTRRASPTSASPIETFDGPQPHHTGLQQQQQQLNETVPERRASLNVPAALDTESPVNTAFMPAGEPSRSHRRASVILSAKPAELSSSSALETEIESREKQLALEDDIHCSLLNLALQMVANGIEPRLDEVIQIKYLVVFYLDFEDCELLSLGQGKFQVRYGEYIPRQRMSPFHSIAVAASTKEEEGHNTMLPNDPGHENFVLTICRNLQLILDRYVEIKPDYERDPPTLYDQLQFLRGTEGGTLSGSEAMMIQSGYATPLPAAMGTTERTFSATTATVFDPPKDSTQGSAPDSQEEDEDNWETEPHHRHNLLHFSRNKHRQDDHHNSFRKDSFGKQNNVAQRNQYQQNNYSPYGQHGLQPRYQQYHHHHYRRNQKRRLDDNTPVVGTYFVDVILRFLGSETDLGALPAGRLKDWLELLFIVIYKYIKEVDPLSDLVVVLMKRIVDMLVVKKNVITTSGGTTGAAAALNVNSPTGEESLSDESILLSISICSTLLKRSSTMTTALLSREIMAMGRLMTRRRDDPGDPVLNRAKNFLHDAFVHFMGSGLFVLVFKTQPAHNIDSFGWEDQVHEVDQDLDLFYVLATVLGEDEMVPLDPSASSVRLVHFRDQPVRDILDRVTIFRELEPAQVSTILINLALYIERVHCKFQDPRLLPDMAQFLTKITKYTAEWDQQQIQKQKEQLQQMRLTQDQQQQQMKQQAKKQSSNHLFPGNTSTMASNTSSLNLLQQLHFHQQQQWRLQPASQKHMHLQQQSSAGSTALDLIGQHTVTAPSGTAVTPLEVTDSTIESQKGTAESTSLSLSYPTSLSGEDAATLITQQGSPLTMPPPNTTKSSAQAPPSNPSSTTGPPIAPPKPLFTEQKPSALKHMDSIDPELNLFGGTGHQNDTQDSKVSPTSSQRHQPQYQQQHLPSHHRNQHRSHNHRIQPKKVPVQKTNYVYHWDYSNAILNMCSTLMIKNPMEGRQLIPTVKHVLKQALHRDRISASALVRLLTGYCYIAEQDFSIALVNAFGEFIVEELRTSIHNYTNVKHGDELAQKEDEQGAGIREDSIFDSRHGYRSFGKHGKDGSERKGKEGVASTSTVGSGEHGVGAGIKAGVGAAVNVGLGNLGLSDDIGLSAGQYTGGRGRISPSNLHLLHHLLIWDIDPSYNMEWTRIKWNILGSMRFPPGHPILFPGANDALRHETALIVRDWVDQD